MTRLQGMDHEKEVGEDPGRDWEHLREGTSAGNWWKTRLGIRSLRNGDWDHQIRRIGIG